ncbi:EspA/EspE family type VII secretion system effector [Mycobacterium sp. ML4]
MTVVKSAYTGGSAIQNQDWGSLGASAGTIVGKGLMYAGKQNATLANALKTSGTKVLPTPTAVVDAAAIALLVVDFLNGFGTPNSGSAVNTASDKFDLYTTALVPGCIPDPRDWSGPAASAYTAQVNALVDYVATMEEYDKTLKGKLQSQASEIKRAHMCITVNVAVLTAAAGVALALYLIPIVGPEVSLAWQIIAAFACCAAVFVIEMLTLANSMSLSNEVAALAQQYVALGQEVEAKMAGTFGQIRGKVATETSSQLSEFKNISDGLSSFSAPPSVSSLAAAAGDAASPSQKALLDAQEAASVTSTVGAQAQTPQATPEPAATAPVAAAAPGVAFTPPSLAQVSQMAGAASRVSQNLSQPLNQTMQGVQQITQMGQQGQQYGPAGAEPGEEDAAEAPADETAAAGAASGPEGAQRAPIDAPRAGTEEAPAGRGRVL